MKLIKNLMNLIFIAAIIIIAYFVWNLLQKQEIIVTDTTKAVITELRAVNKLETAEMTITKIMEAEKDLVDIIPSVSFDDAIQDALFQDKMIFELE
jgi:glycerol kinase